MKFPMWRLIFVVHVCGVLVQSFMPSDQRFRHPKIQFVSAARISKKILHVTLPADDKNVDNDIATIGSNPNALQHPVLMNLYPKMIEYMSEYGHPNIPLPEGKGLDTLRRLHIQGKLSESEITVLGDIGFRFHSLEDVYDYADFNEMFDKLMKYRDEHGDVSPPKKYKYDPELGAWVTGIRRRGPENVQSIHRDRLDAIDFEWTSPRQCGSSFMMQYRSIIERQQQQEETESILRDESVRKWIRAIQNANLSETRQHYMETLLGKDWKTMQF